MGELGAQRSAKPSSLRASRVQFSLLPPNLAGARWTESCLEYTMIGFDSRTCRQLVDVRWTWAWLEPSLTGFDPRVHRQTLLYMESVRWTWAWLEPWLTEFDPRALRHPRRDHMSKWKTISGRAVGDIDQYVAEAAADGRTVHIGTDSLQTGKTTQFVTVVAVLTPHKGGRAAYCREIVARITSLRQRLLQEVWLSVALGMKISDLVKGDLTIHVDANPSEKHMSSKYIQELTGLVVGQGFKVEVKPDAWAATHAADHIVRCLNVRASKQYPGNLNASVAK